MKKIKWVATVLGYLFRAFLAYTFIPHGWEKLTMRINPQEYIDFGLGGDFLDFYLIWENTGFIYLIGFAQLVGGLLLIPRCTYLFGGIWLLPMCIGMVGCHWYISHATDFLWFDIIILVMNLYLIAIHLPELSKVLFKKRGSWI
ncbi:MULTISPECIES: DoxX family membrane protein [Flavobacteriales]|uniref:DoxX n=1 Tax=Bergeyella zoohelcum TaxID=1015 RepID=A0A7Z8YP74_9FLAO|nr:MULTISPECIES: DoxX family membrane protein [Flavobacteriales]VDH04959.1 DoxX [Bergeyella zoohelcum]